MKSLMNRLVLISAIGALPFTVFAGALQTVHSRRAEYDLSSLSDYSQESARESAWRNRRESGFR
jgi:hypothetical protein